MAAAVVHADVFHPFALDAQRVVGDRRLAARQESNPRALADIEVERLLEFSGNHAGLLKVVFFASQQGELALHPNAITLFVNQDSVWDECQKIWDSLDAEEQAELKALATGQTTDGVGLLRLKFKGLIIERQDGACAIFSPMLQIFVSAAAQGARDIIGPLIVLRQDSPIVTIDGRIVNLNALESALFRLLHTRRPQTCSRAELIAELLRAEGGRRQATGSPDRRLEKVIEQIRSKIEIPGRVYLIATAEGGYRLIGQDSK